MVPFPPAKCHYVTLSFRIYAAGDGQKWFVNNLSGAVVAAPRQPGVAHAPIWSQVWHSTHGSRSAAARAARSARGLATSRTRTTILADLSADFCPTRSLFLARMSVRDARVYTTCMSVLVSVSVSVPGVPALRIQNAYGTGSVKKTENSPQNIRWYTDIFLQCGACVGSLPQGVLWREWWVCRTAWRSHRQAPVTRAHQCRHRNSTRCHELDRSLQTTADQRPSSRHLIRLKLLPHQIRRRLRHRAIPCRAGSGVKEPLRADNWLHYRRRPTDRTVLFMHTCTYIVHLNLVTVIHRVRFAWNTTSFAATLTSKFIVKWTVNSPPHLNRVATLWNFVIDQFSLNSTGPTRTPTPTRTSSPTSARGFSRGSRRGSPCHWHRWNPPVSHSLNAVAYFVAV